MRLECCVALGTVVLFVAACEPSDFVEEIDVETSPVELVVEPPSHESLAVIGDVDGNLDINYADAVAASKMVVKSFDQLPPEFSAIAADVNCDLKVSPDDALLIAQYSAGVIDEFPCTVQTFGVKDALLNRSESDDYETAQLKSLQITAREGGEMRRVHFLKNAGIGVEGGVYDTEVDGDEELIFTFDVPMTMIRLQIGSYTNLNGDREIGPYEIEAFGANGENLGTAPLAHGSRGAVNALFDNRPIQKMILHPRGDGCGLSAIVYSDTLIADIPEWEPLDMNKERRHTWEEACYGESVLTETQFYTSGTVELPGYWDPSSCSIVLPHSKSSCVKPVMQVDWTLESACDETADSRCSQAYFGLMYCDASIGDCDIDMPFKYARGTSLSGTLTFLLPDVSYTLGIDTGTFVSETDAPTRFTYTFSNAQSICRVPSYRLAISPTAVQ